MNDLDLSINDFWQLLEFNVQVVSILFAFCIFI